MKRNFLLVIAFLIVANLFAQKGINTLIKTEKDFAAFSLTHGTKDAFLANMDSNSTVFDKNKPARGIDVWNARNKANGKLQWWPNHAEISGSNDFGYTTGPWSFSLPNTDSVIANGYYVTLWHLNKKGKWTFLVDLGISEVPDADFTTGIEKITVNKNAAADTASFIQTERDFISLVSKDVPSAYKKYLSATSFVDRNGKLPATIKDHQSLLIASTSASIEYTINGWFIAPSRDMACVYGSTTLSGKNDNYMRIWRHEKDGWKIALEVLHH
jgi:hypothetical protein